MKTIARMVLAVVLIGYHGARADAQDWPEGLSFVGLKDGVWQLYVVAKGALQPQLVPTVSEPRTPVLHLASGRVAFIAADGRLHEQSINGQNDKVVLAPGKKHAYTQPAYDPSGERLYVVEMKDGVSVDADIVVLDKSRAKPVPVVTQRLAQFEPVAPTAQDLYYGNAVCTLGCGEIIQEIWHMNVITGMARQLTLVNSIARQPSMSKDGQWLYFSSNKAGNYHIWRLHLVNNQYEQLTNGRVTDISPALDAAGNVYFVRRSEQSVQLMRLDTKGALTVMPLPAGTEDLRDVEMGS